MPRTWSLNACTVGPEPGQHACVQRHAHVHACICMHAIDWNPSWDPRERSRVDSVRTRPCTRQRRTYAFFALTANLIKTWTSQIYMHDGCPCQSACQNWGGKTRIPGHRDDHDIERRIICRALFKIEVPKFCCMYELTIACRAGLQGWVGGQGGRVRGHRSILRDAK